MQYYFDQKTKTIISKYGNRNYILEKGGSGGNNSVYHGGAINGRWWQLHKVDGKYIRNVKSNTVLDTAGGRSAHMTRLYWTAAKNAKSQHWNVIYVDDIPRDPTKGQLHPDYGLVVERDFYLVTSMPSRRMASYRQGSSSIHLKDRVNLSSQRWYFDGKKKCIRNREHSHVLTAFTDKRFLMQGQNSNNVGQYLKYDGTYLRAWAYNTVLEIPGSNDFEGAILKMNARRNSANQKWKVVYADTVKAEATKGLNARYGFFVNRPFVLLSQLPMNRMLYHHPNNYLY